MRRGLERLAAGGIPYLLPRGGELPAGPVLLPGSFNPFHRGHAGLLEAAERATGRPGLLELSITNVDKPALDAREVERRLASIPAHYRVLLTCAPTFAEKARVLPGAWFAMGFDTAERLLDPQYHADVPAMLERFLEQRVRFVVAGRIRQGRFLGVDALRIPAGFDSLFIPVPESEFREDISSTELRG